MSHHFPPLLMYFLTTDCSAAGAEWVLPLDPVGGQEQGGEAVGED